MVRSALANRTVLQGIEIDAGLPSVSLSPVRTRGGLGRTHSDDVPVPGMVPSPRVATARSGRREEKMVALATRARDLHGGAPRGRAGRLGAHHPASRNARRIAASPTPPT